MEEEREEVEEQEELQAKDEKEEEYKLDQDFEEGDEEDDEPPSKRCFRVWTMGTLLHNTFVCVLIEPIDRVKGEVMNVKAEMR